MEAIFSRMKPDAREAAKHYLASNEVPQLFEVEHFEKCLDKYKNDHAQWDNDYSFKKGLPLLHYVQRSDPRRGALA